MDIPKKQVSGSSSKQRIAIENVEAMKEQSKKEIEQIQEEIEVLQQLIVLNEQKLALEIEFILTLQELSDTVIEKEPDSASTFTSKSQRDVEDDDVQVHQTNPIGYTAR